MLVRHSLLYVLVRILAGVLAMATTAALTRILDPAMYGRYGLALLIMSIGAAVAFDWLGGSFMRFYLARKGDHRALSTFAYIYLGVVVVLAAFSLLLTWSGIIPPNLRSAALGGMLLLFSYSCFELIARVEIVTLKPRRYLWMNVIRGILAFAGSVFAAWQTHDALWTAVGTSAGMIAGALVGTSVEMKHLFRFFDRKLALEIFWFGTPLAASSVMSGFIPAGTRGLIGALDSSEALGVYTAAFLLVQNTLMTVSSGLSQASYSVAVRAVETGDMEATKRQLTANGTLLIAIMAPACLGMALTANGLAAALAGPRFAPGVALITPWMAAGTFFCSLRFHYLDYAFQLGRKPYLLAIVAGVAAALLLVLNLILIPLEGIVGAAAGVALAMGISCVHAAVAGQRAFEMPLPWRPATKILLSCLVMGAAVLSIPATAHARLLLQVIAGAGAYGAAIASLDILELRHNLVGFFYKIQRLAGVWAWLQPH